MKKYSRVFGYLAHYKMGIFWYFVNILLSVVFSLVSLGMLLPFLNLIFDVNTTAPTTTAKVATGFVNSIKEQLNTLINSGDKFHALAMVCILIVCFIFLKNLFLYLSIRAKEPIKYGLASRFKLDMFNKILNLPIGYFTEQKKGDLMSRMTNDVYEVEMSIVGTLEGWVKDPITLIITLFALFYVSTSLTLFIFVFLPILGFVIGRISRSLRKQANTAALKNSESISILDETLGGLRVIKAFNVENIIRNKYTTTISQLLTAQKKIAFKKDLASPLSEVMGVAMFTLILWYGGSLVLNHKIELTGASFLMYMALFFQIIEPAKSIAQAFSNMKKGAAAIDRINEILNAPITVDENANGKKIKTLNHKIEFKNVDFKYEDVDILSKINLTVEKGKTIALVGSSGAGKSTLADLIPRFHDVTSGELLIDGVNIKDYSLQSARSLMSIVTQEPILFNDTIANNIALGKPDATLAEIEAAAKIANAHNFIIQKEDGYLTNIGDRGSKLSGGERQRLTIARAVLKNPPILILDEATSSLDTESERLVQDAINNLMTNRTSIVIAHRLSTIRHADEIIVLQKGEIVERGTHDELISQQGFYKKLVEMQEVK
jgi:ATP-binding cassette, subfamily B, bacterial MsbA